MVKKAAQIFGWILVLVGILGFIPGITSSGDTGDLLLGIFQVDALHNIIHLVTGAAGVWAAMSGGKSSKMFFQIFGVIYALVAILGFMTADGDKVLNLVITNMADNWLHVVIALVSLYLGFGTSAEE
jgi:hypothetical protein